MGRKKQTSDNIICRNRMATHRFVITEKIECGIALLGSEIKSLRDRAVVLSEAYGRIDGGELWLIGCHIAPYAHSPAQNHDPIRRRKLLVHRRQLDKLSARVAQKGCTLVPLTIHFNERGLAKATMALAQNKTGADKRQSLKKKEHKREMDRAVIRRR